MTSIAPYESWESMPATWRLVFQYSIGRKPVHSILFGNLGIDIFWNHGTLDKICPGNDARQKRFDDRMLVGSRTAGLVFRTRDVHIPYLCFLFSPLFDL